MSEKCDLQKMLREIRDDEAIVPGKATHLSQAQIQELVTHRKTKGATPHTPSGQANPAGGQLP